jgi:hypothetical protein
MDTGAIWFAWSSDDCVLGEAINGSECLSSAEASWMQDADAAAFRNSKGAIVSPLDRIWVF